MILVVTPGKCWLPPALAEGRRLWGIAAQLYLLRSATDWGIGDFSDLRKLVELAADRGADVIGLNPLHAMFPDDPEHASPYSPASRLLLNILNIDVTAVPELLDCPEMRGPDRLRGLRAEVQACRAKHLVDYAEVAAIKLSVLKKLFDAYRGSADPARWRAFEGVPARARRGAWSATACFWRCASTSRNQDPSRADWHAWPEEYRDPASPAVARFAEENRHRLDFLAWLQWVADEQLGAAAGSSEGPRDGGGPLSRPGSGRRPRRRRDLGRCSRGGVGSPGRRAAGHLQSGRTELGAAAVSSARAAGRGIPQLHSSSSAPICATRAGCGSIT